MQHRLKAALSCWSFMWHNHQRWCQRCSAILSGAVLCGAVLSYQPRHQCNEVNVAALYCQVLSGLLADTTWLPQTRLSASGQHAASAAPQRKPLAAHVHVTPEAPIRAPMAEVAKVPTSSPCMQHHGCTKRLASRLMPQHELLQVRVLQVLCLCTRFSLQSTVLKYSA
jgi:hypothetical protein